MGFLSRLFGPKRAWGTRLTDEERAQRGTRLTFEPSCFVGDCRGPVENVISGRLAGSISGPPYDPEVPDFYSQGLSQCRRCRTKYVYTVYRGGLSLRRCDDDGTKGFEPI